MNSQPPRIPPSLAPRDEPIDLLLDAEPEPEFAPQPPRRGRWVRVLLWTLLVLTVLFFTPPAVVLALRWYPPPTSAFMMQSPVKPVQYAWVPAARIPQTLRDGAIAAEDQKFYTHWGFDFMAIAEALEHNEKSKKKRGASTISQQVAKNLFLWPSRSYVRKGLEVTFTLLLELELPKDRILEIYLNIAEFGPGVFGVQAAAQAFFGKNAEELTPLETARLIAVLPNPRKWSAKHPGPFVQTRVDWIMVQIGHGPPALEVPEGTEPLPPGEMPFEPGLDADVGLDPGETVGPGIDEPLEGPTAGEPAPDTGVETVPPEGEAPPAQGPATPPEVPPAETPAPETPPTS
jgi:monofunctional biosynthetic peptidoglycan transglycosylase